jgi:adenylosuccinate lyase
MDAWEGKGGFRDLLLAEPGVAEVLGERALDAALDPARFVAAADTVIARVEALR